MFLAFRVRSVFALVGCILRRRAPCKIAKSVIVWFAVQVPSFMTMRLRGEEGL